MKITYIHHSCFLAELPRYNLLFDYYTGELPETGMDKPMAVFASHRHLDHFSPDIFQMGEWYRNLSFILSSDIEKGYVPERDQERTVFVTPEQELELPIAGETFRIHTFRSTDEGVAFLLDCGDEVLYHAGDLNDWYWNGEPEEWNRTMGAMYRRELQSIRRVLDRWGREIDAAFLPLDGRQEDKFFLGLDEFMRNVGAKKVFPMHFWDDFSIIDRLKAMPESRDYRKRVMPITRDGDSFLVNVPETAVKRTGKENMYDSDQRM